LSLVGMVTVAAVDRIIIIIIGSMRPLAHGLFEDYSWRDFVPGRGTTMFAIQPDLIHIYWLILNEVRMPKDVDIGLDIAVAIAIGVIIVSVDRRLVTSSTIVGIGIGASIVVGVSIVVGTLVFVDVAIDPDKSPAPS